MLRKYDKDHPETYIIDADGDQVEMNVLPLGLRSEYLAKIDEAKTYPTIVAAICLIVTKINGEDALAYLMECTHLPDIQRLILEIVKQSWLPENVSENLPSSPDLLAPEKLRGAEKNAKPDADTASITPAPSFAEPKG